MPLRIRRDADLEQCEQLVHVVHALDGYPRYLPDDLRGFIASPDSYVAWVAERGRQIVGHVALHRRSPESVLSVASKALRRPADQLGVVARLLVSPEARREGVGRSLLHVAAQAAIQRGLWPVLDVVTDHHSAIRLYESCGWVRAGAITVRLPNDRSLHEFVYVGPDPHSAESGKPVLDAEVDQVGE